MDVVGVVGLGMVGGTLHEALVAAGVSARGYDPYLDVGAPTLFSDCSIVFICVPTPTANGGDLDTASVWKAMNDIDPWAATGTIIAVKSTVPPGTSDSLAADFPRFEFASVPEFLVAARPMETLTRPDRVVLGVRRAEVGDALARVMRTIAPEAPIVTLSPIEAELAKLSANAMLAAKVSIANELALVCERFGVEWSRIQTAVGLDKRLGVAHLSVTTERGFGGGCLPKDLGGLIAAAVAAGYESPLLSRLASFNDEIRAAAEADDVARHSGKQGVR